jgi:hypothetical protein
MFIDGFLSKVAESKDSLPPLSHALFPAVAAGLGTYAFLRHPGSLPKKAPAAFKKMREAAQQHGFTRVHLHDRKPSSLVKKLTEITRPADKHVHLTTNKSYASGLRTKSVVFDPEETDKLRSKHMVGKTDKLVRALSKSKLHEYQLAKKMGLQIPFTGKLRSARSLKGNEIAKPASGSQARFAITKKDIQQHDPSHPLLKNFKQAKGLLRKLHQSGKIKDINVIESKLNHHPGYKHWLTEQVIKNPHKFVRQKKINIDKEYRVHTLHGMPLGITAGRHHLLPTGHQEAEQAAARLLRKTKPELKNNLLALDVAKDTRGKWHVIETNPGPASGFLTPTKIVDIRGPHKLYKALTGRYAKPSAAMAGAGVAGATGLAVRQLDKEAK